ncbi:MAG: hypothetical protein WCG60_02610, partial [bacterium]
PTMYTLSDIYNKLNLNTYTPSAHTVSTTSLPTSGTFNTLTEIWNSIPTISASTIATGTTIMGIAGTNGSPALEWSGTIGAMTWDDAKAYCELPANGYTRLPTMKELIGALAGQYTDLPTTDSGFSADTNYWSGIETAGNPYSAWIANYYSMDGYVNDGNDGKSYEESFRCVR